MTDWTGLFLNGLWVFGAALLLAVLGYGSWCAETMGISLREELSRRTMDLSARIGWVAFCTGLAGLGDVWWKRVLWALLALFNVVLAWCGWRAGEPLNPPSQEIADGTS